jgi:hypothetical protein
MHSQIDYSLALQRQVELARRAGADRPQLDGTPLRRTSRASRVTGAIVGALRRRQSEQRELPLTPGRVERAAVPSGCLEVE